MHSRIPLKLRRFKVGDTPLVREVEICKLFSTPHLLIKDESRNEFGTFKDRRNKLVIQKALKNHVNKLAIITSGNAGYSLARFAQGTKIKVVCVVNKLLNQNVKEHLEKYSTVIPVDLSQIFEVNRDFQSDKLINLVREKTSSSYDEIIWDVTNGYHDAFCSIVREIKRIRPDILITPLGSGEAFVGLYEGIKKTKLKTKLIGVGVHQLENNKLKLRGHPSIADKLYTPYTPYKEKIESILEEGHMYIHVSDEEINDAYEKVCKIIMCEPSSAAVFAALSKLSSSQKESKIIVINSGKGIWPEEAFISRNIH